MNLSEHFKNDKNKNNKSQKSSQNVEPDPVVVVVRWFDDEALLVVDVKLYKMTRKAFFTSSLTLGLCKRLSRGEVSLYH
jgi:hypothetical protein